MASCKALLALSIHVLLALCACVQASIYPVESKLWIPPFQHAEKMFATDRGPVLSRAGNSTITLTLQGRNVTRDMDAWRLVVFVYHVDSLERFGAIEDKVELLACAPSSSAAGNDSAALAANGMSHVKRFVFPVVNETVSASVEYKVEASGWVDTQVFVCSDANGAAEVLPFTGSLEIRNPFGLLPAVLYGMLPFSGLLSMGYVVLDVFFAVLLCKHRQQTLQLHYGIQIVLLMGTAASTAWFYAFFRMNQTGEPVCCPYPTTFLIAVILDTLMRTFARVLLIVVCLGYGIVREQLRRGEVLLITVLSLAYFASGVADEITRGTSSGAEFREKPTFWSFIQLLCNLLFIMWIHYALEKILKQLDEMKQSAKLAMYKSLAYSLAGFVVFFTLLTMVAVCGRLGVFDWDVEWEWMTLVAWPVLNFIVSTAMCMIWRPTQNSSQFAFSMQLPMNEKDAGKGMSSMVSAFTNDSDDEDFAQGDAHLNSDDEIEIEMSPPKDAKKKPVAHDSDDDEGL